LVFVIFSVQSKRPSKKNNMQQAAVPVTFNGVGIPNIQQALLDSFIVPNFVQTTLAVDPAMLYNTLYDSAPWTDPSDPDFKYRGNELARRKAFLVISTTDHEPLVGQEPTTIPRYSYPGWQNGSVRCYRDVRTVPEIHNMMQALCKQLLYNGRTVKLNHAILTCYRGADDNIGFHSDKMKDIVPDTPIISLSLGEKREFHFGQADANDKMQTITTHKFVLNSGDLFILGPKTNAAYRHAIVTVDQETVIRRDPRVKVGPRISIVLRDIATVISREEARKAAVTTEKRRLLKARSLVGKRKTTKNQIELRK
jgi:alkylated DNA repair dioxygenase AlkB